MTELAHELAETVSSADAAPGSGWVAGVSAGLAAALVVKAASRSEGWEAAEGARAQALELRDRLLALAGQDVRAYERALSALEQRDASLERSLVRAAEAAEAADGAARADASAAAALASGAARAAVRLVEVNLVTLQEDERLGRARRAADAASEAAGRALAAQP